MNTATVAVLGDCAPRVRLKGNKWVGPVPAIDRLIAFMTVTPGPLDTYCWVSGHNRNSKGYARVNTAGRSTPAHRVAYEHFIGPIPDGLTLDHLCRNRACINPAHLEPVTSLENIRRGVVARRRGAA